MKRKHPALDSPQVRAKRAHLRRENARYPDTLVQLSYSQWPDGYGVSLKTETLEVWRSKRYLVQIVEERNNQCLRLTVNRTELNAAGDDWQDGITWDELMEIKTQCGRDLDWAVEVYPPSDEVVNVANMRHLWLMPFPPALYAWKKKP
jgi:hypothetical protein